MKVKHKEKASIEPAVECYPRLGKCKAGNTYLLRAPGKEWIRLMDGALCGNRDSGILHIRVGDTVTLTQE